MTAQRMSRLARGEWAGPIQSSTRWVADRIAANPSRAVPFDDLSPRDLSAGHTVVTDGIT
jgi:hypothetical protein